MAHLTTKQIKQLIEIDNAGSGIRSETQELIRRLTSGGIDVDSDDPRRVRAKVLWDKGWGRELGMESFDAYFATILEVPEDLLGDDERFSDLILVDPRLLLTVACRLAGLRFNGDDETFEDFDPKKTRPTEPYWMRCQDGRRNRDKSAKVCREGFQKDELGLTAMESVAYYAQKPEIIKGHLLDLPGSVHRDDRDDVSYLGNWSGGPGLHWDWNDNADSDCGSASRRE